MKTNCWEFMKCGRELDAEHLPGLWLCPASTEMRLHGAHGGEAAGRACWVVKGTLCNGRVQGAYDEKQHDCAVCPFYRIVHREEGINCLSAEELLRRLK